MGHRAESPGLAAGGSRGAGGVKLQVDPAPDGAGAARGSLSPGPPRSLPLTRLQSHVPVHSWLRQSPLREGTLSELQKDALSPCQTRRPGWKGRMCGCWSCSPTAIPVQVMKR
ncbi:unnamed protein product [Caretta caretta]